MSSACVFVVARIEWDVWPGESGYTNFNLAMRDTLASECRRFTPVAAFVDRLTAEGRMRELELEAARVFNPFCVSGPPSCMTSLPAADLVARLRSLAGPLPATTISAHSPGRSSWRVWWDDQAPTWTDETLTAVWELFDAIRFYVILEVDAE